MNRLVTKISIILILAVIMCSSNTALASPSVMDAAHLLGHLVTKYLSYYYGGIEPEYDPNTIVETDLDGLSTLMICDYTLWYWDGGSGYDVDVHLVIGANDKFAYYKFIDNGNWWKYKWDGSLLESSVGNEEIAEYYFDYSNKKIEIIAEEEYGGYQDDEGAIELSPIISYSITPALRYLCEWYDEEWYDVKTDIVENRTRIDLYYFRHLDTWVEFNHSGELVSLVIGNWSGDYVHLFGANVGMNIDCVIEKWNSYGVQKTKNDKSIVRGTIEINNKSYIVQALIQNNTVIGIGIMPDEYISDYYLISSSDNGIFLNQYLVGTEQLIVYSGPGVSYLPITILPQSHTIRPIHKEIVDGEEWILCEYTDTSGEGERGYIRAESFETLDSLVCISSDGVQGKSISDDIVYRTTVDIGVYSYRGWLGRSTELRVIEYEDDYALIDFYNGKYNMPSRGYVKKSVLSVADGVVPVSSYTDAKTTSESDDDILRIRTSLQLVFDNIVSYFNECGTTCEISYDFKPYNVSRNGDEVILRECRMSLSTPYKSLENIGINIFLDADDSFQCTFSDTGNDIIPGFWYSSDGAFEDSIEGCDVGEFFYRIISIESYYIPEYTND